MVPTVERGTTRQTYYNSLKTNINKSLSKIREAELYPKDFVRYYKTMMISKATYNLELISITKTKAETIELLQSTLRITFQRYNTKRDFSRS
jgi:hypothetical protein